MKKIIIILGISLVAFYTSANAQNGRPAKIEDNAPKIVPRNVAPTEITILNDKLTALENRVTALEAENAALKSQNAAQDQHIKGLTTSQDANYKVLDYSLSQLKQKMDSQIGSFKITGFLCTKAFGTNKCVNALIGTP